MTRWGYLRICYLVEFRFEAALSWFKPRLRKLLKARLSLVVGHDYGCPTCVETRSARPSYHLEQARLVNVLVSTIAPSPCLSTLYNDQVCGKVYSAGQSGGARENPNLAVTKGSFDKLAIVYLEPSVMVSHSLEENSLKFGHFRLGGDVCVGPMAISLTLPYARPWITRTSTGGGLRVFKNN